ncbi:alpha/beta hydrolase [Flavobacteriales bacterium 34_180_T64]|nr:alpha/beta hydrolase [Flavobacteriales bacterium 34_180_T64]
MSFTRQKKVIRKLRNIAFALIGLYVMIGTSLYFIQERLLFMPTVLEQSYQFQFNHPFEELFLKTDEDASINALHFKAKNPKGVILYFHGNAGDLSRWGSVTEYFVDKHYDVLIMDYRSYGKSIGPLNEAAFYSDAQYCYDFLKKRYAESEISLYGRSLGSGIACNLASKNTPKQLILETPYYSILDVAKQRFPIFPVKQLMRYEFPSYKFIKAIACPISIIHGTDDVVVPLQSGEKLYDVSTKELTTFTVIKGGAHNNLVEFVGYHQRIEEILK